MKLIDHRYEVHIPEPEGNMPNPMRMPTVENVCRRMEQLPEPLCGALVSFIQRPISQLSFRQRVALAHILDALP